MAIIIQSEPKLKGQAHLEDILQGSFVLWFNNTFPDRRGDLFATFHETRSQIEGSQKLTKGLVPGVSDLILLDLGVMTGIEVKYPGTKHKVDHLKRQANWLIDHPRRGYFCDNIEMFKNIVYGGDGMCPHKVLAFLNKTKDKEIIWDINLF